MQHERQFLNIRKSFYFHFHFKPLKTPGKNYLHLISCSLLRRIREEFKSFSCFNSFQSHTHTQKNPFSDFFLNFYPLKLMSHFLSFQRIN